ncbi:hypothetical protein ANACOL_03727 [Anaerotruncus colihominis DSM 17241]|uniref:Uncharacterized protein n=1 Tax=Anaerotruncus colihominis DSM 17241 TaxID=445972 RepID=B0PFZ6_9FIRM|nr:hypothetical protein ANACOL_03727 [Anaerotruncus colihominis DSM 17241]
MANSFTSKSFINRARRPGGGCHPPETVPAQTKTALSTDGKSLLTA